MRHGDGRRGGRLRWPRRVAARDRRSGAGARDTGHPGMAFECTGVPPERQSTRPVRTCPTRCAARPPRGARASRGTGTLPRRQVLPADACLHHTHSIPSSVHPTADAHARFSRELRPIVPTCRAPRPRRPAIARAERRPRIGGRDLGEHARGRAGRPGDGCRGGGHARGGGAFRPDVPRARGAARPRGAGRRDDAADRRRRRLRRRAGRDDARGAAPRAAAQRGVPRPRARVRLRPDPLPRARRGAALAGRRGRRRADDRGSRRRRRRRAPRATARAVAGRSRHDGAPAWGRVRSGRRHAGRAALPPRARPTGRAHGARAPRRLAGRARRAPRLRRGADDGRSTRQPRLPVRR